MHKIRWILTTVIGVALSLMWTFYVVSVTEAQTEPPLDIEIIVAQTEIVLGVPMTWRIILTPCAQVSIKAQILSNCDLVTRGVGRGPMVFRQLGDSPTLSC